jgi:predicted aldo/keto reductase-like oxidoreductase
METRYQKHTDYIDMYLLHNLNPGNWEAVKKYDGLSFLDKMIKERKDTAQGFFNS